MSYENLDKFNKTGDNPINLKRIEKTILINYKIILLGLGEISVLIVGERINSSIKQVEKAIRTRDVAFIKREVRLQAEAGAQVIDINAGTMIKTEEEDLVWLAQIVHEAADINDSIRIAIDSAKPDVIKAVLLEIVRISKEQKPIINSVTAEKEKLDAILPLAIKFNAQLVGLCMNEQGIPDDPKKRCGLGSEILHAAAEHQIPPEDVFLDPLIFPVSTNIKNGLQALEIIKLLKVMNSKVKTIIGLSNISYGLPNRPLLNQTFMVIAMSCGLDAAILNPLDKRLMSMITTAEAILGNDDFCMNYITAYRKGELENYIQF